MRNFLAKPGPFTHVPILTFPVSVRSLVRSHVPLCSRVLRNTSLLLTVEDILLVHSASENTETIRVYVREYGRVRVHVHARKVSMCTFE